MILRYFGRRQVTSAAKGMKLHAIDVPRVANAKHADAKKTPARAPEEYDRSRMPFSKSYGFQYASPYMFNTADYA
jgi:hypothetical protein